MDLMDLMDLMDMMDLMNLMDLMDLMYFFGDPNPSEIHGVWNLFIKIHQKSMDYTGQLKKILLSLGPDCWSIFRVYRGR